MELEHDVLLRGHSTPSQGASSQGAPSPGALSSRPQSLSSVTQGSSTPGPPLMLVTGCDRGVGLWVAREAPAWGFKVRPYYVTHKVRHYYVTHKVRPYYVTHKVRPNYVSHEVRSYYVTHEVRPYYVTHEVRPYYVTHEVRSYYVTHKKNFVGSFITLGCTLQPQQRLIHITASTTTDPHFSLSND